MMRWRDYPVEGLPCGRLPEKPELHPNIEPPKTKALSNMRTALLLIAGSRGDTEPFIALACEMLSTSAFSAVHIYLDPVYLPLIPSNPGIIPHAFPSTMEDMAPLFRYEIFKAFLTAIFTRRLDLIKAQTYCLAVIVKKLIVPLLPHLVKLADEVKPSVVIASSLGAAVASSLAELREIPFCLVGLQPSTPTSAYPNCMLGIEDAISAAQRMFRMHTDPHSHCENTEYLQTYESRLGLHQLSLSELNELRSTYGLKDMTRDHVMLLLTAKTPRSYVINSYSSQLIPPSPDHTENVHIVPPLASSYLPKDWTPEQSCPDIVRYLEAGEKPICITFGSMQPILGYNAASSSRHLLTALRNIHAKRVLVLKGAAGIGPHSLSWLWDRDLQSWADCNVFATDEKPQYAWLLPKCSAMICHGGAGTTFAGLNAGIPLLISPVLCDQFFWGELLQSMGLGAVAGPSLGETSTECFESALKDVLADDARKRSRSFGEEERRRGNGSKLAAELLCSIAQRAEG